MVGRELSPGYLKSQNAAMAAMGLSLSSILACFAWSLLTKLEQDIV